MRTFEVMFIAAPNTAEDDLKKLTSQLETVVADLGGTVTKVDQLGRRKLAYPIQKFDEGIYSLLNVEGSGREIAELERRLRVSDIVIRHMTVRTDEDLQRAAKLKAGRKTAAAARSQSESDLALNNDDEDMEE
ncbi:MAG: 30S ribosomal protein S6 [Acidobacteria bacterium]|nr:30S ribosomal protein S6 [Acidobacteriota bacterium]MCW5967808.1 30S ribosomal protein S6 [Blastocatellales bacterium]